MEAQLDSLVRRIKSDGVESARKEAADIIAQAKEDASRIVANAEDTKREIIHQADTEAKRLKKTVEDSLRQAARDMILAVRKDLEELFRKLLQQDVGTALTGDSLERMILELMKSWPSGPEVDIQLSEADTTALAARLLKKLKNQIASEESFVIKPIEDIKAGLRISFRDGTAYFDFTDKEISSTLAQLLNPKFVSYLS